MCMFHPDTSWNEGLFQVFLKQQDCSCNTDASSFFSFDVTFTDLTIELPLKIYLFNIFLGASYIFVTR